MELLIDTLSQKFDNLIVFDTETTGLNSKTDEIIEFGGLRLDLKNPDKVQEINMLIKLDRHNALPPKIVELTGITDQDLAESGISKDEAASQINGFIDVSRPLVAAYNAQFDFCFLYYFLASYSNPEILKKIKMLDIMTVYKDRQEYPHRLFNAIDTYEVQAENTHRAIDDAWGALKVLEAMASEKNDIMNYINIFGYNPKYGLPKPRIQSITYQPQYNFPTTPVYARN